MKALTLATISAISVVAIGTVAFAAGPGMGPMGMGPMGMMGMGPEGGPMKLFAEADTNKAVSYTHLTLPTTERV